MIELADIVVVKGKPAVGRAPEVIAPDARSTVDGRERPAVVPKNPTIGPAGPVENQVIEIAAAVVVEGKPAVAIIREVIVSDDPSSPVNAPQHPPLLPPNPNPS